MTPVFQTIRHDPENGAYGDCHRAAIASALNLAIDAVPHFHNGFRTPAEAQVEERTFLASIGIIPIYVAFPGETALADVLITIKHTSPGVCGLLGGKSPRGYGHSVVIADGEIVHDPHPDGGGIVAPFDEDGLWWVTWFGDVRARSAA
ncbi:MAG: Uncharacterized protein FD152_1322 [Xanthobacteraceae bacterium]|nr:MAG: Uncharacterized protein FD152_1322 [Xanthobacteraceae bacterium]